MTTLPPTPPPTTSTAPTASNGAILLQPLINKTPPGGILTLDGSKTYQLVEQSIITKAITINYNGGYANLIAPNQHAAFNIQSDNVIVSGLKCSKANIFFYLTRGADHCLLKDCLLSNVLKAVHVETGCKDITSDSVIAVSNSVTFYAESGLVLKDCRGRSVGEYAVRWEEGSKGNQVIGGEYSNAGNIAGKDTFGTGRWGDGLIDGVRIHGNIRVGQDKQIPVPKPGAFSTLHIKNCFFFDQSPGHGYVEILQGAEVFDDGGNTFAPGKNPNWIVKPGGGSVLHPYVLPSTQPATKPSK